MENVFGKIYNFEKEFFESSRIFFENGKIVNIKKEEGAVQLILPGLIDSHVHIESSMLIPSRFAELAVRKGVIAVVTDPHEISNVLGVKGFEFMLNDAENTDLKIYFGVPSCVPATPFETSGAVFDPLIIEKLIRNPKVVTLSEMMNFPGALNEDSDVLAKISVAKKYNKKIDGHAPGLTGEALNKYIASGISTDHEAYSYPEAKEKIEKGMMIQIREGSAAKNFDALWSLVNEFPDKVMLCTDDSHPDDLINGYIDVIVKRLLNKGVSMNNIYKAVFFNPIKHYGLNDIGMLKVGDKADFIMVDNMENFNVLKTVINGKIVFDSNRKIISSNKIDALNVFNVSKINTDDIKVFSDGKQMNVIKAIDGELITDSFKIKTDTGEIVSNINDDILKLIILNRYEKNTKPVVAFINGFGFRKGPVATSIAHDSHNIVAVGTNDSDIVNAINKLIEIKGGVVVANQDDIDFLKLDIAGLMSSANPEQVIDIYKKINERVKEFGTKLKAPFMTLSFMSLLVIPKLKLSDKGLFDVEKFSFTNLFE